MASTCVFCEILTGERSGHMVLETAEFAAFLDARPLFKGHTLIVPREHIETLPDLPVPMVGPYFEQVQRLAEAMVSALGADGSFIGQNNTISQSVPHLHTHVVPRTRKDGLRGFFWPRTKYRDEEEAAMYAAKLRAAL